MFGRSGEKFPIDVQVPLRTDFRSVPCHLPSPERSDAPCTCRSRMPVFRRPAWSWRQRSMIAVGTVIAHRPPRSGYRGSDLVLWHTAADFRIAASWSGYKGTFTVVLGPHLHMSRVPQQGGLHAMVLRFLGGIPALRWGGARGAHRSSDWSAPNKRRNAKHCRDKSGGISTFEHGNVL
jgi:hypothetical protein